MWRFIKLKKVWIPLLLIIIFTAAVFYNREKRNQPQYSTEMVKQQDLHQTVSVTGTVKASEEVNLNFKTAGRLSRINVKVGDKVKANAVLAELAADDARAAVLTAQANLKTAQANLAKLRAGAQTEDIAVSQAAYSAAQTNLENAQQALTNTKASQDQAVSNAWAQLVGLPAVAVPAKGNISTVTITVSGTYSGLSKGVYTIKLNNPANLQYSVYGLETLIGSEGSRTTPTSLGTNGLLMQFSSSGTFVENDIWTVEIPNTSNTSYATYQAAYDAALTTRKQQVDTAAAAVKSAEQALLQAEAQLSYKLAPARSYDIASAEAQVDSARAALLKAQLDLADRQILAPGSGTITQVNNQVGETTSLSMSVIVLLADSKHEIKVQVPEADIAKLKLNQKADITLDAFGSSERFSGHISFIDPAATVIQDVVYYQLTVLFDNLDERIKPGMTANLDIAAAKVDKALVIPWRAINYDNREPYVEVLQQDKQVMRRYIAIGLRGDDGLVEVRSGLNIGEQVITYKGNSK